MQGWNKDKGQKLKIIRRRYSASLRPATQKPAMTDKKGKIMESAGADGRNGHRGRSGPVFAKVSTRQEKGA